VAGAVQLSKSDKEQIGMEVPLSNQIIPPSSGGLLTNLIRGMDKVVNPLAKYGSYIGALFLAVMMFLTFFDVISNQLGKWAVINSRTDFFGPIIGGQELVELLMLVAVSFALAYCALRQGHIRVDLIMQYTSKKANLWFDIFAYGVSMLFYVIIAWQAFKYGLDNIHDKNVTTILTIPTYPFNFIVFIGSVINTLVFLRDFLKSIEGVKN
jgi:TRAP-type C4-dicarboxylate transport system permease small subunit